MAQAGATYSTAEVRQGRVKRTHSGSSGLASAAENLQVLPRLNIFGMDAQDALKLANRLFPPAGGRVGNPEIDVQ